MFKRKLKKISKEIDEFDELMSAAFGPDWFPSNTEEKIDIEENVDTEEKLKCPNCGSILEEQWLFADYFDYWTCTECGVDLYHSFSSDEYTIVDNEEDESNEADDSCCSYSDNYSTEDYSSYSNKKHKRNFVRRHFKGCFLFVFILLIIAFVRIGYYEFTELTPISYSKDSLIGMEYKEVVTELEEAGFTNVNVEEIKDLAIAEGKEENLVTEIELRFLDDFDENTKYPSNLKITVVYHTIEMNSAPLTAKEVKGMQYEDVIMKFENAGFENVKTVVEYDIVTGWMTEDGEVKSVAINGDKRFDSDDEFRFDSEVIITYHTLRKNKPK